MEVKEGTPRKAADDGEMRLTCSSWFLTHVEKASLGGV